MKFKDDEWLTDYINALHFTTRFIETQHKDFMSLANAGSLNDREIAEFCKIETDALIQEAILCNMPIEVFSIRRITERLSTAQRDTHSGNSSDFSQSGSAEMKTYQGDSHALLSDYRFLCRGLEEFTLQDIIEECYAYLKKIYPDIPDMKAAVAELLDTDLRTGLIREIRPGVYGHV